MREKEVSKRLPRFVTWATGRLMVPFMGLGKGSRFRIGDEEFNYRQAWVHPKNVRQAVR